MNKKLIQDTLQWDTANWSVALNYWNSILAAKGSSLTCLELGANKGGLSLWLAMNGHKVLCSDLTNTQNMASALHKKYFLDDKITYSDIDATSIPFENHFDAIVLKSILGGIGRNNNRTIQQQVIGQIYKALKPGGVFLFAENSKGTRLHRFFRRKFTRWGHDWLYLSADEMRKLLKDFSKVEIKTNGFAGVFGRNEKQKNILGKIDRSLIDPIIPSSWNYILYGMAEKK